jgi:N-formylglutamate amidohydrolase
LGADGTKPPVQIIRPAEQSVPLVVASPHSGCLYEADFLAASKLDPVTLRRSEDAHVHLLAAQAPALGAPLIHALFPRAYLDANREPYELDPGMFVDPLPSYANTQSPRVSAGLGTIARMVGTGSDIYRQKLTFHEAEQRIDRCYRPYHAALAELIEDTRRKFGFCILIDCHSMPSGLIGSAGIPAASQPGADFVLGDCHGTACARLISNTAQATLIGHGYRIARNAPYAGGFTTRHYGVPKQRVHALQIEISRHLYMDERTYEPTPGFAQIAEALSAVFLALSRLDLSQSRRQKNGLLD